ncbi:MAM domain and Concanavalin A-like lectin/glucanases superfamily domain-containing protein [Strongyloides ratti]|uniref:MAM domain and Concanavalin A-like lectin/glucanases superfamily domain-containing protein n=1 Tax=Strongyloides ratti TaxID=34506 RepID=A0A090LD78_STRRB|nr:MAM domain and Concanavalin A-like lectin/glucanases superfamily domain-containing protein [Strongyloides ratti]CEF67716.1 MAM domain and Concanavalin A-like lectin/glucanases superfamily domain-containing protein [Strongyloides ratti]
MTTEGTNELKNNIDNSLNYCDFENNDLCGWISLKDYWKITQNVELDAIHSISTSPTGVGNFIYIQKDPSIDEPGYLISPEITSTQFSHITIQFYYRKNSISPIIDICVTKGDITKLRCLESISDKGPQQWIFKNIRIPDQIEPFKIVFRVRNMKSIMDVVAIDQINIENIQTTKNGIRGIKPQKNNDIENVSTKNDKKLTNLNIKNEMESEEKSNNYLKKNSKTPQSFNFNVGEFPSFAQGVDIFRPNEETSRGCVAVRCSFMKNSCLWSLDNGWKRIDGNLAIEKIGSESITSGLFLVPLASFFEFDLWMSNSAMVSITQTYDNHEEILFSQKGMSSNGWHRFRIPLQAGFVPSTISIKAIINKNDFVTISNVKLVNSNGEEISCETVQTEPQQKISVQQIINKKQLINNYNKGSLQRDQPILARLNGMPVILPTPITMTPIKPLRYNNFERLTSLQQTNLIHENTKIIKPRIYPSSLKTTTPSPKNDLSNLFKFTQQIPGEWQQKIINSIIPGTNVDNKDVSEQKINNKQTLNIGKLLSSIGGQPLLENQLKHLAQKFGFTGINDPRAIELFQKFVNNPMVNQRMSELINNEISKNKNDLVNVKTGVSPIIPINANVKDFEKGFKEKLMNDNLKDSLKDQEINSEIIKKFAKFIELPTSNKNDQQPFTRNNLDFIVHNALSHSDSSF